LRELIGHAADEPLEADQPFPGHLPAAFGRYELQALIGEGAMGRVYRALDPLWGRAVAIKTIKTEFLTQGARDAYLHAFRREAAAARRLSHANIVSIFDVGDAYMVMEFVAGVTLSVLLAKRARKALALPSALGLLSPLADALDHAHRAGRLHRDVKPANIMIRPDGQPKLMDLGIARVDASVVSAPGHFLGSPAYLSPEQIRGEEATTRADLFSFAVVAYEVFTGYRPFEGDSVSAVLHQVAHEPAAAPRSRRPDLPTGYDDIFGRALAKTPKYRFPSARAFVAALRGE
jgi:serine/threonine-protein kinase